MACRQFGTKPLPEPMLAYCELDPWEQISMNSLSKFIHFHSRKWERLKMSSANRRPFCPGGDELIYIGRHYDDVIMGAVASQITSLTIVYSAVDSDADQRKHHRGPVNSPDKWPVTRKMSPFDDVIMALRWTCAITTLYVWDEYFNNIFRQSVTDKWHTDSSREYPLWYSQTSLVCSPFFASVILIDVLIRVSVEWESGSWTMCRLEAVWTFSLKKV